MGNATGQLIRIAAVAGGAVGERVAVSFAPPSYQMIADGAALGVGVAACLYLKSPMIQNLAVGIAAGGAVGLASRIIAKMRAPSALEAGAGGPALSAAVYEQGTGTYGRSRIPPELRVISK